MSKKFEEFFLDELRDLYDAETQLLRALPKMAEAASTDELRAAFEDHLVQTRTHVERLDDIFDELQDIPGGGDCKAMKGLVAEASEAIASLPQSAVRDASLIAAVQRVEHYEMAGYGCVRTFAKLLGRNFIAEQLQTTLDEEKAADELLTQLAEGSVNAEAAGVASGAD